MTRILLVHERFAPDSGGGGEYVALERARWLRRNGYDVRVICAGDPALTSYQGVPTKRYRVPRQAVMLLLPFVVRAARSADLVHSFTFHAAPLAWMAARIAGRPVVCEQLGLFGAAWREMRPGLSGRLYQTLERWYLNLPYDEHLFLSEQSRALALRLGFRRPGTIVSPGLEPADFGAIEKSRPPVVLFAGKLDRRKGFDRLCAVARAMPDVRFRAVGWSDGALPEPPPPNVDVIEGRGEVYRRATAEASVLFMPSRAETFGIVIYEAMQAGCSIVSTIDGDYAGARLDPWSLDAAVAALRPRVDDPAMSRAEGETNRARSARYTWQASSDGVQAVYRRLIGTGTFEEASS